MQSKVVAECCEVEDACLGNYNSLEKKDSMHDEAYTLSPFLLDLPVLGWNNK